MYPHNPPNPPSTTVVLPVEIRQIILSYVLAGEQIVLEVGRNPRSGIHKDLRVLCPEANEDITTAQHLMRISDDALWLIRSSEAVSRIPSIQSHWASMPPLRLPTVQHVELSIYHDLIGALPCTYPQTLNNLMAGLFQRWRKEASRKLPSTVRTVVFDIAPPVSGTPFMTPGDQTSHFLTYLATCIWDHVNPEIEITIRSRRDGRAWTEGMYRCRKELKNHFVFKYLFRGVYAIKEVPRIHNEGV
ncbi:hypothetical protein LTR66_004173 [Elasticomyces elasticus]|nr:hypothetical protein LTR66_004173 [Elasticomyces elasticus]